MKQNVVVTGGAKGIGACIARAFLEAGDSVVVIDTTQISDAPLEAQFLPCDLSDEEGLEDTVDKLARIFPKVDVLINNAGHFTLQSFDSLSKADWDATLETNLTVPFLSTRSIARLLGAGSVVVNISSSLGRIPEPEAIAYSVAKAGVNMLTRCLALEFASVGIRVLGVAPGPIASGAESSQEVCQITGENLAALNPLGRFGTVDEVASLVTFLASEKASYMTGSIVSQNGGEDAFEGSWSGMRALRDTGALTGAGNLAHLQTVSPSERVRLTAARVLEEADHVSLNEAKLQEFVSAITASDIKEYYRWDYDYHPRGTTEQMINYVFSIDAVNFGSGFSPEWKESRPYSTYETVAGTLTELLQSGNMLDAAFAASITNSQVRALFGEREDFPLISMFTKAWNSLGSYVQSEFGSYPALLESLPDGNAAQALIDLLVENVPEFNDHCVYKGGVAYFYKRAQILVNDLHLALGKDSPFSVAEIAELTMFADNLVAHVLETEGVLTYSPELKERITSKATLPVGSQMEAEIRAAEILCVEKATVLLKQRGDSDIFRAMLDVYLWNRGQEEQYKQLPRHLTKTFFY